MKKVMFFVSFTDANFPGTLYALQLWCEALKTLKGFDVIVGVETGSPRLHEAERGPVMPIGPLLEMIRRYSGLPVFVYTPDCDAVVASLLYSDAPTPFFPRFSFGAYVNRMLLLACSLDCDFAIRFDPGTMPPDDLDKHAERILAALANDDADVCSGVYVGRLALRDDLVTLEKRDPYYRFIHESTGVSVRKQITGGAMFAQRMPGIPAIPFPPYGSDQQPTLVWASDDGFFQMLQGPKCVVLEDLGIPRFALVGKSKPPVEYYRGVAGMVCLEALRRDQYIGLPALRERVHTFVGELNGHLDLLEPDKRLVPANVAPDEFLGAVREGWDNYQHLACRWSDITDRMKQHGCALRILSSI